MSEFQPDRIELTANLADEIHGSVLPIRLMAGGTMATGNIKAAADEAYEQVSDWARSKGFTIAGHTVEVKVRDTRGSADKSERTLGQLIADIYSCTELKVLESYRLLARIDPMSLAAYEGHFERLSHP